MLWLRSPKITLSLYATGLLFLSGCAALRPLPTEELATFNETLVATRAVGEQVLETWDKAARTAKARQEAASRPAGSEEVLPYPKTFNARDVLQTTQEPDPASVRLLALDTVAKYTELLLTLAAGRSVAQVQASAEQLRVNLQTFTGLLSIASIPGLAVAGPLIETFAGALETARGRQEFRTAVEEGEPIVSKILDFLIDDTTGPGEGSGYYTTVFALNNEKRLKLRREITDAVGSIVRIVADHAAPTDPNLIRDLDKRIVDVLAALRPPLKAPDLVSRGTDSFSERARDRVMTKAQQMELANNERMRIVEGVNAYHTLLTTYVRLLSQTQSNLKELVLALERPIEAQAAFERTLGLALQARREIRIVRNNL
jgi:hypothetical protein